MAGGIPVFKVGDGIDTSMVIDNKIAVINMSHLDAARHGILTDHTYLNVRGHNHALGTVDEEISALGTLVWGNWPAAAAGVVLVSTDVNDDGDPVSTGARTVIVRGLDANWAEQEVTITMNGTTATTVTTETFIRIHELEVVTAGSSLSNEGVITASIGGTDIIAMYAKHTTSEAGRFTVPAGKTGYFQNIEGSAVGNQEVTYHIFCRDNSVANKPFLLRFSWHSKNGGYRPDGHLEPFAEKTDLIMIAHAAAGSAACSASLEGYTEVNPT